MNEIARTAHCLRFALAALVVGLGTLQAVGEAAAGTPSARAVSSSRPEVTVRFWAVGANLDDVLMYRRIAERFEARTGIAVKVTPLGWGDFETKYFAAMAGQIPPDIGITNLGGPAQYGSVGGVVDLKTEFKGEIEPLLEQFHPEVLPQLYFRDKLFGLPAEAWTVLLYYRKDILEQLGVPPPRTWSELDQAIRAIEAKGMRFYYGWTRAEQWSSYYHTLPFGFPGARVSSAPGAEDVARVDWLEPAYQRGILHALELWHMHENLGEGMWGSGLGRFLTSDLDRAVPILVDANWLYQQIADLFPEQGDKWDILPWPRADEGKTVNVIGGSAYVIFNKSVHKREAFAFLQHLSSLEVQREIVLDRITRKENGALTLSPIKSMWGPENDAFWTRSEFVSSAKLVRTMSEVVRSFETTPLILGKRDTDRLELGVLDRMGGYVAEQMTGLATKNQITRAELVKRFAKGELASEHAALEKAVAERLEREYRAEAPKANALLAEAQRDYDRRFGQVVSHLAEHEGQRDVLWVLEWLTVVIVGLALLALVSVPRLRRHIGSYAFVAPPVLLAIVFVFVPALCALYLSFTEYHPVLPLSTATLVGVKNYTDVMGSGVLLSAIRKTAVYVGVTVPIGIALSLGLAALLNNNLRGSRYWRFIYFSPFVTSAVSVALVFVQLYQGSEMGWINALFLELGIIDDPILFLSNEKSFMACVIALAIWHGLAFNILIFLAGLQQVPAELYRAAEIDGAGWLRKFWHVSIPGIRPQLLFVTIMGIIGGFQVFEPIYMLGGGSGFAATKFGPNDAGLTMVPYIYSAGFEQFRMGQASAIAYILFVVILAFTVLQLRLGRDQDGAQPPRAGWRWLKKPRPWAVDGGRSRGRPADVG